VTLTKKRKLQRKSICDKLTKKRLTDLKAKSSGEVVSTAEMDFKAKMDNFDYAEFIEDTKNENR
jgi:hypothetical protein